MEKFKHEPALEARNKANFRTNFVQILESPILEGRYVDFACLHKLLAAKKDKLKQKAKIRKLLTLENICQNK